ncbi:MAG: rhodanese-like domain-containing protein [Bacteroidia bacterium]
MYIEQMYTNCLAEAAYYVESEGEALIIDPIRETSPYLEKAGSRKTKIRYVLETHFHADFISGHIDLAKKSGATIVFGPGAETGYPVHHAKDGEELHIGKLKIRVLHTPGHTPESTSYLLLDEKGKPHCIFTGDTLFVGDVGRPDLLDGKMSSEELGGMLYDSLYKHILTLPDDVIVYPAHGPGSACGKNIGKETWSTIGEQKKSNYALQPMSKNEFIKSITEGLTPPPSYFFKDAMLNKTGYEDIEKVMQKTKKALTPEQVQQEFNKGTILLDTRDPSEFEKGFIPGSLNIGLNGSYAIWAATLIDLTSSILIIAEEGKEEESVLRLARVGFENIHGFLKGGFKSWTASSLKTETVHSVTPAEFNNLINQGKYTVIDVRKPGEYETVHVKGAKLVTLSDLEKSISAFNPGDEYLVHCAGGYRSMIASSILKKHGITHIHNVYGGMGKLRESGTPVIEGKPVA